MNQYNNFTLNMFAKIHNIKIPNFNCTDYYLNRLCDANIIRPNWEKDLLHLYNFISDYGITKDYIGEVILNTKNSLTKQLTPVVTSLQSKLLEVNKSETYKIFIPTDNIIKFNTFISFDLVSANKTLYEYFIPDVYKISLYEAINNPTVVSVLEPMKYLREIIFGQINGKSINILLQYIMTTFEQDLSAFLGNKGYVLCETKGDELIYGTDKSYVDVLADKNSFDISFCEHVVFEKRNVVDYVYAYLLSNISKFIRTTVYEENRTINETFCEMVKVRTYHDYRKSIKKLFGVNGKLYYYYLSKYILNKPIQTEDLYFFDGKNLAMYVVDLDKENFN